MRVPSWTAVWILASALCVAGLSGQNDEVHNDEVVKVLVKRRAAKNDGDSPLAATVGDDDSDSTPTRTARSSTRRGSATRTAARSSATATRINTRTRTSARRTRSTQRTIEEESTTEESTAAATSTVEESSSESSTAEPTSTESVTSTSTESSSTSTDPASQPTAILAPEPQNESRDKVSVGGIVTGVVLGIAALIGIVWIVFGKWRETKRQKAERRRDAEAKQGFIGGYGGDNGSESDHDTLVGGKGKGGGFVTKMRSLRAGSAERRYSFETNNRGPYVPETVVEAPQDVLPTAYRSHPSSDYAVHNHHNSPLTGAKHLPDLPETEPFINNNNQQQNPTINSNFDRPTNPFPLSSHPYIPSTTASPQSSPPPMTSANYVPAGIGLGLRTGSASISRKPLPPLNGPSRHTNRSVNELPAGVP